MAQAGAGKVTAARRQGVARKNEAVAIASQYRKLEQQNRSGVISFEQARVGNNQIVAQLVALINDSEGQSFVKSRLPRFRPWKFVVAAGIVTGIFGGLGQVLDLIHFFPRKSLQLTVFVTDARGNVALENEGRLNIPLGNRSLNEIIGANGRANFPDITADNLGDTLRIGLEAEGWELADNNSNFIFDGKPIHLTVKRDDSLGKVKGLVKSRDGQEFIAGALVLINTDTTILTDSLGIFRVTLPEEIRVKKHKDRYLLTVSKKGYQTTTEYYSPGSSDADIRLEKAKSLFGGRSLSCKGHFFGDTSLEKSSFS